MARSRRNRPDPQTYIDANLKVVRNRGDWADCICPGHDDNDPSLSVNVLSGGWICRSCDQKGPNIASLMRWVAQGNRDALNRINMQAPTFPVFSRQWTVAEEQAHRDRQEARRILRKGHS
jgi:hypothetical protein